MSRIGIPWQLDSGLAAQLIGQQAGIARQGLSRQLEMAPDVLQQAFGPSIQLRAQAAQQIAQMRQQQNLQKQAELHDTAMAVGKAILEQQRLRAERGNADDERAFRAEQGGLDRASREKIADTRAEGHDSLAGLTTLYNRAQLKQEMGLELTPEETAAVSLRDKATEKKQTEAEKKQLVRDAGQNAIQTHRKIEAADSAAKRGGAPPIDRSQGWRDYLNKWASDFPGATWDSLHPSARASLSAIGLDQSLIDAAASGALQKQVETAAANVSKEKYGGKTRQPIDFMERTPGDEPIPWMRTSPANMWGGPGMSGPADPGLATLGRAWDDIVQRMKGLQLPAREDYTQFVPPQYQTPDTTYRPSGLQVPAPFPIGYPRSPLDLNSSVGPSSQPYIYGQ